MKSLHRASAIAIFALVGCGGASRGATDTIVIKTEVHIVREEARQTLGGAPEESRIAAAASSLEKSLGHPIVIDVDAALTPPTSSGVIVQTANSIEALARFFGAQERSDPQLFAFTRQKLVRVAARYRASAEWATATFDDSTGTLVCTMREPRYEGWVPDGYTTSRALEDAYARDEAARFGRMGPANVSEADFEAYFRYLHTRRGDPPKSESDEDRGRRVLDAVLFEPRVRGTALGGEVEKFLAEQAPWIMAPKTRGSAPAALFPAYAHWIDERFFATNAAVRSTLYERLYRDSPCADALCLPELDRTRLALGFFERPVPEGEKEFGAFDQALCLYEETGSKIERNRSCASVYGFLTANDARSEKLVAVLARTGRREFLVAALANARGNLRTLLRVLEKKGGALYSDAFRILIDCDFYGFRDQSHAVRDEITRLWPQRADLRPLFLRSIVQDYVATGYDDESVAALANEYRPLDAALFAKFLDDSPRSVELAPALWPALRNVSTPFEIIAPRLSTYVEKRGLEASKTVAALVRRACQAKDLEGLRVIRVVLQNRAKAGDKDSMALALAARDCKAPE